METKKYVINLKNKNEKTKIFFHGDIHLGSQNCGKKEFEQSIKDIIKDETPHKIFIGMGDIADEITPSDPRFDLRNIDAPLAYINEQYRYYEEFLKEMEKNGIKIGLHIGNHATRFMSLSSTNFTKDICSRNNYDFLGYSCLHLLELKYRNKILKRWRIATSHGASNSRTPGGAINSLDKKQLGIFADVFVQGHNHKLSDDVEAVLWQDENADYSNPSEEHQKIRYVWLGNSGSFLKTFKEGTIGYGERKDYRPNVLGYLEGVFTPKKMYLLKKVMA